MYIVDYNVKIKKYINITSRFIFISYLRYFVGTQDILTYLLLSLC